MKLTESINKNAETNYSILIPQLLNNEIVISPHLLLPFCQAHHGGPQPIKTIQESQQFLASILSTFQNQFSEEPQLIFLANQDKPVS